MSSANEAIVLGNASRNAIREMHAGILLKVLIQRVPHNGQDAPSSHDASKPELSGWCRFIDELSHLCDFENGGSTVKSIAVQDEGHMKARFWMASNPSGDLSVASNHLSDILLLLQQLCFDPDVTLENVSEEIFVRSVELSHRRIRNYLQLLQKEWEREGSMAERNVLREDPVVEETITALLEANSDCDLCHLAGKFGKTSARRILDHLAQNDKRISRIRHYVGRLGSWSRASQYVTQHVAQNAAQLGPVLQNFDVRLVPREKSSSQGTPMDISGNFESVVDRACPWPGGDGPPQQAVEKLRRNASTLLRKLQAQRQIAQVHAEAAMLHHFYKKRFSFMFDERYIGCSKPSCYCCSLYFREHPSQIMRRQCSGNAWLKWYPPGHSGGTLTLEAVETLQKMVQRIQEDVRQHIARDVLGGRQCFDSTTGWTFQRR